MCWDGLARISQQRRDLQDCSKAFFVDGHLYCDVRECIVYGRVWQWRDCRVVTTVLVVMSDGTDCKCECLEYLKSEELERVSGGIWYKRNSYQGYKKEKWH